MGRGARTGTGVRAAHSAGPGWAGRWWGVLEGSAGCCRAMAAAGSSTAPLLEAPRGGRHSHLAAQKLQRAHRQGGTYPVQAGCKTDGTRQGGLILRRASAKHGSQRCGGQARGGLLQALTPNPSPSLSQGP